MLSLPSSSELHYFLEVAHTLNLSRAAERLGVSQPALSLAMQRLENSFGVPLLIRSKTGVQLTRGGQRLVTDARTLLHSWEKLRGDALLDHSKISGRFVLGCHASVALYALPSFLPTLLSENPSLEFKLVHDLSRRLTEDVVSFKVDFGIVVNPAPHPDLVIKRLCKDEVSFWVTDPPSSAQDPYSGQGTLICDPDLVQSQALLKQMNRKGLKFARTLSSSSLEVITELVGRQAGVGILPGRVALRVPGLKLKPLPGDLPKLIDHICLVYRADAQKSPASRLIARVIEQALKPMET